MRRSVNSRRPSDADAGLASSDDGLFTVNDIAARDLT